MIAIRNADDMTARRRCEERQAPQCDVYDMTDRGQLLATAGVVCEKEEAQLLFLEAPDAALTDAMLRAVLNAVQAKGAVTAKILPDGLREFMQRKEYFVDSTQTTLKIDDFFAKTCCNR